MERMWRGCFRFSFIILQLFVLPEVVVGRTAHPGETLYKTLFKNYEKEVIPAPQGEAVTLEMGMDLVHIGEVNEDQQYVDTHIWSPFIWGDSRLVWDPKKFGGIDSMRVSPDKIWKPDITLYNNAGTGSGLLEGNFAAALSSDGNLVWIPPSWQRSFCRLEDVNTSGKTQSCSMKFGSWVYSGESLTLKKNSNAVGLANFASPKFNFESKWKIENTSALHESVKYDCCPENYESITYTIEFTRAASSGSAACVGSILFVLSVASSGFTLLN